MLCWRVIKLFARDHSGSNSCGIQTETISRLRKVSYVHAVEGVSLRLYVEDAADASLYTLLFPIGSTGSLLPGTGPLSGGLRMACTLGTSVTTVSSSRPCQGLRHL